MRASKKALPSREDACLNNLVLRPAPSTEKGIIEEEEEVVEALRRKSFARATFTSRRSSAWSCLRLLLLITVFCLLNGMIGHSRMASTFCDDDDDDDAAAADDDDDVDDDNDDDDDDDDDATDDDAADDDVVDDDVVDDDDDFDKIRQRICRRFRSSSSSPSSSFPSIFRNDCKASSSLAL